MPELVRAIYKATYRGHSFDILTWEGTPLNVVWNSQKSWFSPGAEVIIEDNHGNKKEFIRGMC